MNKNAKSLTQCLIYKNVASFPTIKRYIEETVHPIIHLLPGKNGISFVAIQEVMNVQTAIQGIAGTVGSCNCCLNTVPHNPNPYIHPITKFRGFCHPL